ncbi:hypothetical protein QTJ16_003331 [Diplocarpon rosae]|uniref:glutathione transferase n=1 Tax=Diplocarpon rosae TaxID=946125 RepID=A0AAD9T300_9HELO|nr:hypothetical protein QTJ16_003331 [Diplocarpon rosae]PBP18123.1 hypothetical protein BUE80_DR010977 [Diplocarpon rosae]
MGLILHGFPFSTCTQLVLLTLAEKGVEAELKVVDLSTGAHKSPEYLKLQPFGKVPVLEDEGHFVYESRAIARYIAKKYAGQGTPLIPEDLKAYGLFEQAASIEQSYFNGPASRVAFEKVFKPMFNLGATDETVLAKHVAELDGALKVYETILSKQPYLAGDAITLADLCHLPYGSFVKDNGFADLFAKYPAVNKWFEGLQARPTWAKATGKS